MDQDQARILREAHDAYAGRITKMTKAALAAEYRAALADRGAALLAGGPVTKDEFICALLNLRYPLTQMNESIHVLYHVDGITNDTCAYCHPDPCPACGALDTCTYDDRHGPVVNGRHVSA